MNKFIILIALAIRIAFLPVFDGLIDDGTFRTISVWHWLRNPFPIVGTTQWPVLNYLLPALAVRIGGDVYWSVRILYLLIATTNVVLLFAVTKRLFGERAAWIAGLILAVNPYHIQCALSGALSEPLYVSFSLAAMWFAIHYRERPRALDLVLAGVCVTLATMSRFDGVIWGPICGYIVMVPPGKRFPSLNRRGPWAALLLLGFVCSLFPAYLVARWSQIYGDPLYFFHRAAAVNTAHFPSGNHPRFSPLVYQTYALLYWPACAILILTPVIAVVAYVGMIANLRRGGRFEPAVAFAVICAYLMLGAFRHTILCQFRYTLILQVLLLMCVAEGVDWVTTRIPRITRRRLSLVCGATGIATYAVVLAACFIHIPVLSRHMRDISPLQPGAYGGPGMVRWIASHAGPDRKVLVAPQVRDACVVLGTYPLQEGRSVQVQTVYNDLLGLGYKNETSKKIVLSRQEVLDDFRSHLREADVVVTTTAKFELMASDGFLPDVLEPPADPAESFDRHGMRFTPEAVYGQLRAYRVLPVGVGEPGRADGLLDVGGGN